MGPYRVGLIGEPVVALYGLSCYRTNHGTPGRRVSSSPPSFMKLIVAVIRPEKLADVKRALFQVGVTGMTLSRVSGHGGERDVVQQYRGESVVLEFHEKVRIEMACSEEYVERTIQAICDGARTGDVGDGKIFVLPLDHTVRIRTGERDNDALTAVNADEVMRQTQLEMRVPTRETT